MLRNQTLVPFLALLWSAGQIFVNAGILRAEIEFTGTLEAQWIATEDSHSWLEGGLGVLRGGETAVDSTNTTGGSAQFALRWQPNEHFLTHLHLLGTTSNGTHDGGAGVVEAYVEISLGGESSRIANEKSPLRFRLGTAFLPTTFENVAPLWRSPYTVTSSALTTWIGEEFRPTGLQVDYQREVSRTWTWNVGASLFGGTDSSGALLAWRGWSLSDRVSIWGEAVPLPPLPSLSDDDLFGPQRDDGTQPFGSDLDGEVGWATWLGSRWNNGTAVQATVVDTRGDRGLHQGEYAWETEFAILGGQLPLGRSGLLAAEWMWGSTGMQPGPEPRVQLDFSTWYLLANWQTGRWHWTLRWENFETIDRARFPGVESIEGNGEAWTAAVGVEIGRTLCRLEWLEVDSERLAAVPLTGMSAIGGQQIAVEVEFTW